MYIYNTLSTILPFLPKSDQNDCFSKLPEDVLGLIVQQLPINNVRTLHTVSHKFQPIAQPIINAKIQMILENAIQGNKNLFYFIEKSNAQPAYSEARIQTLRDAFCSSFEEKLIYLGNSDYDGELRQTTESVLVKLLEYGDFDYKLATQLFKIVHEDSDYPCKYSYKNQYLQKRFFLTMDLLAKNQISPKSMKFEIYGGGNPLDEKIMSILLRALKNPYLHKVNLKNKEWNKSDLNKILTVIKKNEKINTLIISEAFDMWQWNFKHHGIFFKMHEDHMMELNTVINDQLGTKVIQSGNEWTFERNIKDAHEHL